MKLLFLYLMFGFSAPGPHIDRVPQSERYSECDSREVAKGIQEGIRVPRGVIFHYGKKELLMKDVAEGNISESDWKDFIMGDKTRFKLKRFRRGFYGTEYAEDADPFGDATYNWLVEIDLNQECLKQSRVASLVYLPKNPAFKNWYESKAFSTDFKRWVSVCFDTDSYPRYGRFVNYKNPGEAADFSENECEKVVAEYYEDEKFAFVHDYAGELVRSWAIRDRSCISGIHGSDQYWATAFATREEFWVNTCNRERNHRNNIRVWFSALENTGISVKAVEGFSKLIHTSNEPEDSMDPTTAEMDRFVVQDFVDALVAATKRCGNTKSSELKTAFGEISRNVDDLQSMDVKTKLEKLCR